MRDLAIIIPAYKDTFLPAAIESIAAQTCRDFTVYVGDDCSPHHIEEVVDRYRDRLDIVYHRFKDNLGERDLVAQWERCVALSQGEPYIWLFSDDDVMEKNGVEQLLNIITATKGTYDLYHFDVNEINEDGEVTKVLPTYPSVLSAYDYYKGKGTGKYRSYVIENVFSRNIYEQTGGFKNFDLAWGSDVATWCIFCGRKGMYRIPDAHVFWRRSSQNITPDKSRQTSERKLMAECGFLSWAYHYFCDEKDIWLINKDIFISKMMQYKNRVGWNCYQKAFSSFFYTHGHHEEKLIIWFQLNLLPQKLYHLFKKCL